MGRGMNEKAVEREGKLQNEGKDMKQGRRKSNDCDVNQAKQSKAMWNLLLYFDHLLQYLQVYCVRASLQRVFPLLDLLSQVDISCSWTENRPLVLFPLLQSPWSSVTQGPF
jgi:hypothetical protein